MKRCLALLFLLSLATTNLFCEQNILVFLGPPGAGKGVLCKRLSNESGLPHISTGNMLRQEQVSKNSPLAIEVAEYMKEGQLVPDDVIIRVLMRRINQPDCKKGFILEGFPRTVAQAKILDTALPAESNLVIVNLKVKDDTIVKRLLGRRTCSSCKQRYHVDFFPPRKEDVCDHCASPLVTRNDDCELAIRNRLQFFHDRFGPIETYYKKSHNWVDIDAEGAVEKNYSALLDQVHAVDLDFVILNADS